MKHVQLIEEAKKLEEEYYIWGFGMNKKSLQNKIKLYRHSGLDKIEHRFNCFYKRKGLKRAYKEKFVNNVFDMIYLFFL